MKTIKVTVEVSGAVTVETSGFRGKSCQTATEQIERALGVAGKRVLKPEAFAGSVLASPVVKVGSAQGGSK